MYYEIEKHTKSAQTIPILLNIVSGSVYTLSLINIVIQL